MVIATAMLQLELAAATVISTTTASTMMAPLQVEAAMPMLSGQVGTTAQTLMLLMLKRTAMHSRWAAAAPAPPLQPQPRPRPRQHTSGHGQRSRPCRLQPVLALAQAQVWERSALPPHWRHRRHLLLAVALSLPLYLRLVQSEPPMLLMWLLSLVAALTQLLLRPVAACPQQLALVLAAELERPAARCPVPPAAALRQAGPQACGDERITSH